MNWAWYLIGINVIHLFWISELIKLQRNSEKYELLRNDAITTTDKEDFIYTKVREKNILKKQTTLTLKPIHCRKH